MRKLLISLGGALLAASTISGVAFAKGDHAQIPGGNGRGPDLTRIHGANDTPGVRRGRGPDLTGHAHKGLCNAFSHNSDQGKAHGLPFQNLSC
jgi:hypothetical protein